MCVQEITSQYDRVSDGQDKALLCKNYILNYQVNCNYFICNYFSASWKCYFQPLFIPYLSHEVLSQLQTNKTKRGTCIHEHGQIKPASGDRKVVQTILRCQITYIIPVSLSRLPVLCWPYQFPC